MSKCDDDPRLVSPLPNESSDTTTAPERNHAISRMPHAARTLAQTARTRTYTDTHIQLLTEKHIECEREKEKKARGTISNVLESKQAWNQGVFAQSGSYCESKEAKFVCLSCCAR